MPSKAAIKALNIERQNGLDAITGQDLPSTTNLSLVDGGRIVPKSSGGLLEDPNVQILSPVTNLAHHGNLRHRPTTLDDLKSLFDDRVQTMKLALKINNQLLAYQRRTDNVHPDTETFLLSTLSPVEDRLSAIDKSITKAVARYDNPLAKIAMGVPGLGPITVTALSVYIDLTKAPNPTSLWLYAGISRPSYERYTKGETSGGNKTLRTALWNTANVMVKLGDRCPYRLVYDRMKTRLSNSETITKSRNTQGQLIEIAWKDAKPCHRHGTALRASMKHVLADYWLVGRELAGLPTRSLYAEQYLGHSHIIAPRDRGWVY